MPPAAANTRQATMHCQATRTNAHSRHTLRARAQVYDKRPPPPPEDDGTSNDGASSDADARAPPRLGGAVRLEPNAIRALTAISRRLAASVLAEGSSAQHVTLHDMQGERVHAG